MGLWARLWKSNELKYLEQLYLDTKDREDKQIEENLTLKNEISNLKNNIHNLSIELEITKLRQSITKVKAQNTQDIEFEEKHIQTKLSNKENLVYEMYLSHNNFKELLKHSGMGEPSLRVYLSRIRKKGWNTDKY